jgi:cytochrome P450 PksS
VAAPNPADINIASPAHKADPFPFYARLRAESPAFAVKLADGQTAWLVSRYDDAVTVLKDDVHFIKDKLNALTPQQQRKQPWLPPMFRPLARNMLDVDSPDHPRLRMLVQKAFAPRIVERVRPRIESLAGELLDSCHRRGRIDLVRDYALPLPTTVIAEMLGIPSGDRKKFHRWSGAIVTSNPTGFGMLKAIPSIWSFLRYIRRLVRLKRQQPADDLLTALVQAEEAGAKLNEDELVAMVFLLLVAGHETTVSLIGNGMLALLRQPDQWQRLRDDPSIVVSAVEELLRFAGPLETATERYAQEGAAVAGVSIPRGDVVFAALASANRDERQFPSPQRLDLGRDPNRHLAFGMGPHFCLGAALARMEAQIAIRLLASQAPGLQLDCDPTQVKWRRGLVLRGVAALPMRIR